MTTESTPTQQPEKTNRGNNRNALVLLILLFGSWAYFLWDKNQNNEIIRSKDTQITQASGERDALKLELDAASIRYEELRKDDLAKDSVLDIRNNDIAAKKTRIRELLNKADASKSELNQAKAMIASLNDDIEQFKQQIAILQQEKAALTTENQTLSTEKNQIQQQYDQAKQEIVEKDNAIDIGSTLHASNFNVMALDLKKNGNVKETSKAKKVDKLRIRFDIDENRITKSGTKLLYIVITDPNGKILNTEETDASFPTRENGRMTYSQKMEVNYQQSNRQTIEFDWNGVGDFQPGNYRVEVYNNGFKIGEGVRPLRKAGMMS